MSSEIEIHNLRSMTDGIDDEMRAERAEILSGPDSATGHDLARAIGDNLARLRAARDLSTAALAARADIPEAEIKQVEAAEGLPGLRMIWRLASALNVPFGALLEHTMLTEKADPDFRVQRSNRGRIISTPEGLRSRALNADGGPGPEVYDLTLAAGMVESAEAHAEGTYEHIVVTAGQLRLRAGDRLVELGAGDSILFRADVRHQYENPADTATRALLIMIYG